MSFLKPKIGFTIGRCLALSGKSSSWSTTTTSQLKSHSSSLSSSSSSAISSSSLPLTSNQFSNSLIDANNGSCFVDIRYRYSTETSLPSPPKRSLNVFALFVKDRFKTMPNEMPIKEKFVRAGEEWRHLSPEQKDEYKRRMTDGFVQYRKEMASYLDSLSPEALHDYKKQLKEKTKEQTRHRIKLKLRKLNYPKRNCSAYIFFVKAQLKEQYPDGVYPAVRTPEHIRMVGMWSQRWRNMSPQERKPYDELAEADRARYFEQLEKWKHDLAKPENEEDFQQLERLSKKMESCNRSLTSPDAARKEEMRKEAKKRKAMAKLAKRANASKTSQQKKKKTLGDSAKKSLKSAVGSKKSVASGKKLTGKKPKPEEVEEED